MAAKSDGGQRAPARRASREHDQHDGDRRGVRGDRRERDGRQARERAPGRTAASSRTPASCVAEPVGEPALLDRRGHGEAAAEEQQRLPRHRAQRRELERRAGRATRQSEEHERREHRRSPPSTCAEVSAKAVTAARSERGERLAADPERRRAEEDGEHDPLAAAASGRARPARCVDPSRPASPAGASRRPIAPQHPPDDRQEHEHEGQADRHELRGS